MVKNRVAIVGGGTAGILLSCFLDQHNFDVHLYEGSGLIGRKFLVAGDGGFNLTNGLDGDDLSKKYYPDDFMLPYIGAMGSGAFRRWLQDVGIPTYVGSSGRVFPVKGIKPYQVLAAIRQVMDRQSVTIHLHHLWQGLEGDDLLFSTPQGKITVEADTVVYALGGASWSKTGSTGLWLEVMRNAGVGTRDFKPRNCGWSVDGWSAMQGHYGKPLKNISVHYNGQSYSGELLIADYGLEGGAIYAAGQEIDVECLDGHTIHIDLKPQLSFDAVVDRLPRQKTPDARWLRRELRLSEVAIGILKAFTSKDDYQDATVLARLIKQLPIHLSTPRPIDEAISTSGGIARSAVDADLRLHDLHRSYCIGEMLDWTAPTGGYLIQGCVSMAYYLAQHLNDKKYVSLKSSLNEC